MTETMMRPSKQEHLKRRLPAAEAIVSDIIQSGRSFLPGPVPDPDHVRTNLSVPILIGGLDHEEVALVLSALPKDAESVYLSPMDKGLSGAKVFSLRYDVAGRRVGKAFVLKLGDNTKIDREVSAIERLVLPDIYGIGPPLHRRGPDKGMLVQELVGLAARSRVGSLSDYVRGGRDPAPIIRRLLYERLGNWYQPRPRTKHTWRFDQLFARYLEKVRGVTLAPASWGNIEHWLHSLTSVSCHDLLVAAEDITRLPVTTWQTVVHGDLHCQNVLIDEHDESWPIDFAWCHENSSPLLDATMLECSLKFFVVTGRADIQSLIDIERHLAVGESPPDSVSNVPYAADLARALSGVLATREFVATVLDIPFVDYQRALYLMTWILRQHPGLNQPYILVSLALLAKSLGYSS